MPRFTPVLVVLSWLAPASARAAATCAFDPATATVTVNVGGATANLLAVKVSGQIRLNGTACGAATVSNTDAIQVNGTASVDTVSLTGSFTPGLTPEADGASEIEMSFALAGSADVVTVNLGSGNNRLTMTASGIDVGGDLDEDITTAGIDTLVIDGQGGNDIIDASAYTGTPVGGHTTFHGGPGNDRITGTELRDQLYGDDGDDTLYGLGARDRMVGGMGDDLMFGGAGNDEFWAEPTLDGADVMRGGADGGRANYELRTAPVNLTLGNGLADDGEAGEGDNIEADVTNATGGSGDDVLIGSSRANSLDGRRGNDEIHGGAGDDILRGEWGDDSLFGDDGDDILNGESSLDQTGNDVLTGGDGSDVLYGDRGDDLFFNADAFADQVYCGDGIDDPEPDPLDTFSQCESI
jgi:Ca2+-binding RTX toxin-like protein